MEKSKQNVLFPKGKPITDEEAEKNTELDKLFFQGGEDFLPGIEDFKIHINNLLQSLQGAHERQNKREIKELERYINYAWKRLETMTEEKKIIGQKEEQSINKIIQRVSQIKQNYYRKGSKFKRFFGNFFIMTKNAKKAPDSMNANNIRDPHTRSRAVASGNIRFVDPKILEEIATPGVFSRKHSQQTKGRENSLYTKRRR